MRRRCSSFSAVRAERDEDSILTAAMTAIRFFSIVRVTLMTIGALTVVRLSVRIFFSDFSSSSGTLAAGQQVVVNAKTRRVGSDASSSQEHILQPKSYNSAVKVFFLVGLEGTGHHMYSDLVSEAPAGGVLNETRSILTELHNLLYRRDVNRTKALWTATCQRGDDRRPRVTTIMDKIVKTLRRLDDRFVSQDRTVNFHLNGIHDVGSGAFSYPNNRLPCPGLSYPHLELWYEACDRAQVDCQHMYIYRDPYSVVKSTVINRVFHRHVLEAIEVYTNMLQVIHFQLSNLPSRIFACWDYDKAPSDNPRLRQALMFQNQVRFEKASSEVYKPRDPLTEEERLEVVSPELQPYMDSMVIAHQQVVDLCHRQVDELGIVDET